MSSASVQRSLFATRIHLTGILRQQTVLFIWRETDRHCNRDHMHSMHSMRWGLYSVIGGPCRRYVVAQTRDCSCDSVERQSSHNTATRNMLSSPKAKHRTHVGDDSHSMRSMRWDLISVIVVFLFAMLMRIMVRVMVVLVLHDILTTDDGKLTGRQKHPSWFTGWKARNFRYFALASPS
jgi:hypothetical protein